MDGTVTDRDRDRYRFLQDNNLLYEYQYGFRQKRSTVDTVTEFVKDRLLALDNNEHTFAGLFFRFRQNI